MKRSKVLTSLLYNFVLASIFFGGLLRKSYNADTITYMVYPVDSTDERLRGGRYLIMLFDYIFGKLGIRTTDYYYICIFLSIILLAASITLLQSVFKRFISSKNLPVLIGYNLAIALAFCNVLFMEYFMFVEMTVYMLLGFFLATLGVFCHTKHKIIPSILLFAVAVCCYQMVVSYAAIVLLFYYMLEHEFTWSKKAVLDEISGLLTPMCLGGANVIAIKIVSSLSEFHTFGYTFAQSGEDSSLAAKVSSLFSECIMFLKNSFTLLPSLYLPGIIFLLSFVISIYLLARSKGILSVLYYLVAIIASLSIIFSVPLLEEVFYFPPRMSFLLYVVQGFMLVTLIVLLTATDKETIVKMASYGVMGYMWIQMLFSSFIVSGRYISNTLDMAYSKIILQEIEKYEEENNTTVSKITVVHDGYAPAYYDESKIHYEQINERIIGQTTRSALEAWFDRHLDDGGTIPEEIYNEYFAGKDWDSFDVDEQLVIKGDTAYLCVY
ncbi:MAG: glucosyltransferase domain-containing protein [Butyrivibrio sp.]|nr:glucosyltransferase domain-containing protein [Butyrivibrio sp.]